MKYILIIIVYIGCSILSCCSQSEIGQYFVRPCEFVCDYPYNDTTKWVITCRVWGLLKYYHPNITAGKLDWDEVLLDRLDDIEHSRTPEMLNAELKKMLNAAGEYNYKKDAEWNDSFNMNVSLCWLEHSFLDEDMQDELKKIASLQVEYPSYYGFDVDTVRNSFELQHEKVYENIDIYASYEHRLLALFRYWNVIYYYFPHKYLMDKSWDRTLAESVFPFINATDKQSYQIAFLKLAASLNDGHAFINFINYYPIESQNLIELVEEKTVIRVDRGGLFNGDIVKNIGKVDVDHIRDSLSVLTLASTQGNKEFRINCYLAEMIFFNETEVTVLRDGRELNMQMLPVRFAKNYLSPYKWISNDIGYVDLSELTTKQIDLMYLSFSGMKSIIFDLRKLGPYNFDRDLLYCYLSNKKTMRLFEMVVWDLEYPGRFGWFPNPPVEIPECPRFEGEIVFLINESSQSSLETIAWTVRTNFNATLIGRPTSGALGQVKWIPLPGNHIATYSGVGLFSLDRVQLQRKGIIPDIEVYPTMESIKAGKDEVLEAAIEYINNH